MKKYAKFFLSAFLSFPLFVFSQQNGYSTNAHVIPNSFESLRSTDTIPTIQSSNIILTANTTNNITLNWTDGNGVQRLMFVREGDTGIANPDSSKFYWGQTVFKSGTQIGNSGWYCVLNGGNGPLSVTGLESDKTYRVQIFDYNGVTYKMQINRNTAVGNPANVSTRLDSQYICLVTVDTVTSKNNVIWEKPPFKGKIEGFKVYKETSSNTYTEIGNVPYKDYPIYTDLSSVPEIHIDKYKILVYDSFGNTSMLSPYHKTMNLVIASSGSTMGLHWDEYIDEAGKYIPPKYYIFRGTQPNNIQLYDSVSGSISSYNDMNIFSVYYYQIGFKKEDGCNEYRGRNNNWSFSNKKDNASLLGIRENAKNNPVLIYPNPFTQSTTISFPNESKQSYNLRIFDLSGKVVREIQNIRENQVVVMKGDLSKRMYYFELLGAETFRGKLIIE